MAQEIGAFFFLTSAKNGKGIKELFDKIGYKIINQNNEINIINNNIIHNDNKNVNKTKSLKIQNNRKKSTCC